MADWVQLAIGLMTIAGSVATSLVGASWWASTRITKQDGRIEANTTAIKNLAETTDRAVQVLSASIQQRATTESVLVLAQRLDKEEGRAQAESNDLERRLDRKNERISKLEMELPEFRAEMRTQIAALTRAVEALTEQSKQQSSSLDIIGILNLASQAAPLVGKLLSAVPQRANA